MIRYQLIFIAASFNHKEHRVPQHKVHEELSVTFVQKLCGLCGKKLNIVLNPEVSDTTGDDSSTKAGHKNF